MKRRVYEKPATEVVRLKPRYQILTVSENEEAIAALAAMGEEVDL